MTASCLAYRSWATVHSSQYTLSQSIPRAAGLTLLRPLSYCAVAGEAAAAAASQGSHAAVQQAEVQLESAWRMLPAASSLRFMFSPSQLPRDLAALAAEFQAAINRRQQQVQQLQEQLGQQGVVLQQAQQASEMLQQRLAAAGRAAELTVGQVAGKLEAKWGKRVLRAEQKVAALVRGLCSCSRGAHTAECACCSGVGAPPAVLCCCSFYTVIDMLRLALCSTDLVMQAQEHQQTVAELQQQLLQLEQSLMQAQQAAEQHADDKARLAAHVTSLEADKGVLAQQLEGQIAAKRAAEEQVGREAWAEVLWSVVV